jgi:hypothetical protein
MDASPPFSVCSSVMAYRRPASRVMVPLSTAGPCGVVLAMTCLPSIHRRTVSSEMVVNV